MCGRSFRTRSCGRCSWTMTPAHQAHNDSNRNPGGSPPTLLKKKRPCRVSVNIIGGLNEFLKTSPSMPESVQKLQQEAGIKLVLTNLDRGGGIVYSSHLHTFAERHFHSFRRMTRRGLGASCSIAWPSTWQAIALPASSHPKVVASGQPSPNRRDRIPDQRLSLAGRLSAMEE